MEKETSKTSHMESATIKPTLHVHSTENSQHCKINEEADKSTFSYPKYIISKSSKPKRLPLTMMQNTIVPSTPPSRYAEQSPKFILRQKQWKKIHACEKRFDLAQCEDESEPMEVTDPSE